MIRQKSFLAVVLVGLSVLGLVGGALVIQKRSDAAPAKSDRSKDEIEAPAKQVLAKNSGGSAVAEARQSKVAPGKIKWHATFDAACEAANKSGKPVLLFQMMGKLDEQFC